MVRELLSAVVLTTVLWSVWKLGTLRSSLAGTADTPLQLKMKEAERIVHYRFDADSGPVFHLDSDEVELRLVTHLVLDSRTPYSAQATYDYGLRLRIEDPGGRELWQRDIHTSTRQSKEDWTGTHWQRENAFSLEHGVEITDDRVHLITLPPNIPRGARFRVFLEAPAASHGLVRAYERSRETSLPTSLGYYVPDRREEHRLVGRLTYLPWDALSEQQQQDRLRLRWDRMSALGEVGDDYEVETIYYTGFRAPPTELPPPPPVTIVDDRATALTAWGPGELRVWVHAECEDPAEREPETAPSVELLHLDAMGVVDGQWADPCGEGTVYDRWLPPGPHTIHVRGDKVPTTVVDAWYDDHREDASSIPGLELGRPHRPTITRSPRVRLGPGLQAAHYTLVEPENLESAMLRIRARLPVPPLAGAEAQAPATIHYAFRDRHGEILERGEWTVEPDERLEEYEYVVDAADDDRRWWVSPARTARFIAPEGTRGLSLEADGEVIVALYAYWAGLEEEPRPHPPYDEAILVGTRWRRIPIDYRRWHRLSPYDAHLLQRTRQTVDLHGPIRLELPGEDDRAGRRQRLATDQPERAPTTSPWVTVAPYTRHEKRTVLLRTEPGSPWARYSRWRPGRATLAVDDDWGANLLVMVDGDPEAALGRTLRVTIDGHVLEHTLLSTRSRVELPGLDAGRHELELDGVPEGVRVLVDRPGLHPARGRAEQYRVVTLYRLGRRTMGVQLDKTGSAREYLNALVFRCEEREPSRLSVTLDDGTPRRRRGVVLDRVTRAVRDRELPATGQPTELVFLDREQASCESIGRVPVPLGPDLETGRHRVSMRLTEGPDVWVRFFRRGTDSRATSRAVEWSERRLDLEPDAEAP